MYHNNIIIHCDHNTDKCCTYKYCTEKYMATKGRKINKPLLLFHTLISLLVK